MDLAAYDVRSGIGREALKRLNTLEKALGAVETEANEDSSYFPSDASCIRLNDSLIFMMDMDPAYLPPVGNPDIWPPSGEKAMEWAKERGMGRTDYTGINDQLYEAQARRLAKFLGLVARVHNFVNTEEGRMSFPGCRTVIASGLRKTFHDRNEKDDFLAINFSLRNAYFVQESGSAKGFIGNNIFLDDNVARVVSSDRVSHGLLYFSQFTEEIRKSDPFVPNSSEPIGGMPHLNRPHRLNVEIHRRNYSFTALNPDSLSNLQLADDIGVEIGRDPKEDSILNVYANILNQKLPSYEKLTATEFHRMDYPFYWFPMDISRRVEEALGALREPLDEEENGNNGD